ncbi:hypothetical protein NPIL_347121 [Nephila pilipes]|uniref:Uncharacterized protein n=1 Tax=Nephila pilipes TaxID=299642 RepID=A0A8X6QNQ0_NEPPI|nr:hypothetical protein NPIL_347121 [Nephila pilipes]
MLISKNIGFRELTSGREKNLCDLSEEDSTFDPVEFEAYISSEDENCGSALLLLSEYNSRKKRQNDMYAVLLQVANYIATDAIKRLLI